MAEVKYESKIVSNPSSIDSIFRAGSDMRNLQRMRDLIPQDKVSDLEFEQDYLRFKVDGLGQKIGIRIVDKETDDYIKYGIENAPVDGNCWIQMKQVAEHDTRIKLTVRVDLPMMFKMMIGDKVQTALDQVADALAKIPFDQFEK